MKNYFKTSALIAVALWGAFMYAFNNDGAVKFKANRGAAKVSATIDDCAESANTVSLRNRTVADGVYGIAAGRIIRNEQSSAANVPARAADASANVELYGTLLYSTKLSSGIYKIPTSSDQEFELKVSGTRPANGGAALLDRKYNFVVSNSGTVNLHTVDVDSWQLESTVSALSDIVASAAVYDPTTDCIYGSFYYNEDTEVGFGIGHYPSGYVTMIADLQKTPMVALAVDASGQIFGIDLNGVLYRIDKTTGDTTVVGNTGIKGVYNTSGAIDPATGIFYFAQSTDDGGYLYTVDTANASATLINTFPNEEEIGGMFILPSDYADAVPAAPTNLSLEFDNGATSGNVIFTTPATTYDGVSASGELTYTVRANGKDLATGSAQYGQTLTVPVSVQGGAHYTFTVFVDYRGHEGPRVRATQYIGTDKPAVPNVKATFNDEEKAIYVAWDAILAGASGGYINPAEVTYTVTRISDGTVLATDITETSYKDTSYGSGSRFQYQVVAKYGDNVSEPGLSNELDMTVKYPPYLETFDTRDPFDDEYTIIGSGNGDNKWSYYKSKQIVRAYYDFEYPKDEWLITPAIMLEGGKKYKFSFLTYTGSNSYEEKLEVYMGRENTKAGMTTKLLEKTWSDKEEETVEITISPEETGVYYFGFHACSEEDTHYLYIDNISVSAPTGDNVPAASTDLTITPGAECAKTAEIKFTSPAVTIQGADLDAIEKIELYRESNLLKTFEDVVPGAEYTFTDEVSSSTTYTYYVYAYNDEGMGTAAKASAYIGVPAPLAPANVSLIETENPGEVTMSWAAPATFADGQTIIPSFVSYQIKDGRNLIASLSETSYTFRAVNANSQDFVSYEVLAVTEGGSSDTAGSDILLVGVAQSAPYTESFANASSSSPMATELISGLGTWKLYSDSSVIEVSSQDGDNGFLGLGAASSGTVSALLTGRYDLRDISNAALTFYTFPVGDITLNQNSITVSANEGNGWTDIKEIKMSSLATQQAWNKVTVPLNEYDGKTIQLKLTFDNNSYVYTFIDNIVLDGINTYEVVPSAIVTPYIVDPDEEFDVKVYVANNGIATSGAYTVELLRNGETVGEAESDNLACGENEIFTFTQLLDNTNERENKYVAKVNYSNNPSNVVVETEVFTTTLRLPYLPVVSDLSASVATEGVLLSWNEPDLTSARPATVTDDFEDYTPWSMGPQLGEWTLVDMDNALIGGVTSFSFPSIPGIEQGTLSYFVLDNSWDQLGYVESNIESYKSKSGKQYLSNMYNYNWEQNDDWAISPELYGGHQIVNVFVRSFSASYPEAVEILYSTTDKNPDNFIHATSLDPVPYEWTAVEAVMPEGARYFAVRARAVNAFMMFVDDCSFVPAGAPETLDISNYAVYRDGERIGEAQTPAFVDKVNEGETHEYYVTAIYDDHGESVPSNKVSLLYSGVNGVNADSFVVRVADDKVIVTGAAGRVTMTNATGQTLYSADAQGVNTIPLGASGVYIIRDANNVRKILVK